MFSRKNFSMKAIVVALLFASASAHLEYIPEEDIVL